MTLVVPNVGEGVALAAFLNKTAPQDQVLKLFKNDVTPGEADTAATYTEATFTGYSSKPLTGATWTVTPGAPSTASYPQQSFTSGADQTAQSIYGYYVVQATSGTLLWAERFTGAPYVIQNNGDAILVTPQFTLE